MALQYKFKGKSIEICMCLYARLDVMEENNVLLSRNYLPLGIVYFDVFKERRPKDYYIEKITIFKGKHCNFNFWRLQPHWWVGEHVFH
jgi:hypothetical protein